VHQVVDLVLERGSSEEETRRSGISATKACEASATERSTYSTSARRSR